ncbi:hypothetical protein IFM89_034297 [Coptis chinensis]|uniref:indole-3-pyruvate monooxygenase n=1 Tax=Coptis chinensis TaxID=261450 RepID=A0A835IG21_9MAGN|nr:hypothetical protein IFM89_034297 [Coptis chinensis]
MKEEVVVVVGAGPSGIATSACLNRLSIPNIILEREKCMASLWRNKSYDRVHLHLAKQFCQLPYMGFPATCPTYMSKKQFIQYLDDYASNFDVSPSYDRVVESATYDRVAAKWCIQVRNTKLNDYEEYLAKFLVVATGETCDSYVPSVEGLETFPGEVMHSTQYKSGQVYRNKNVLVVGCGNSGMEIALDLAEYGAKTSIVVRGPYGISRPKEGPFIMKQKYGTYPVIDVGTLTKINSGEIQVLPSIKRLRDNEVEFANGKSYPFDALVFATGFKRSIKKWLKDDESLLDENGVPKLSFPDHNWKGQNGLYCAGLAKKGLIGVALDAQKIATDIKILV